jgi:hypothetical protein
MSERLLIAQNGREAGGSHIALVLHGGPVVQ